MTHAFEPTGVALASLMGDGRAFSSLIHDLRTPLGVILGAASELSSLGTLTAEQKPFVNLILRSARRLARLASVAAELAAVVSRHVTFRRASVSVHGLLGRALPDVPSEGAAVFELPATDPTLYASVDPDRTAAVLSYMLGHCAERASQRVEVRVDREGSHTHIEVRDDGPPLGEESLQVFSSAAPLVLPKAAWTLALTRAVVEAQGGTVHAENVEEREGVPQGVRFLIALPTT